MSWFDQILHASIISDNIWKKSSAPHILMDENFFINVIVSKTCHVAQDTTMGVNGLDDVLFTCYVWLSSDHLTHSTVMTWWLATYIHHVHTYMAEHSISPVIVECTPNVVLMLADRIRRGPNINVIVAPYLVFRGSFCALTWKDLGCYHFNQFNRQEHTSTINMIKADPENTKHFYNICTMLDQRRRRWADVVQMI